MLTNEQIIECFTDILEEWIQELREWDTSRRVREGLTFGSLVPDHRWHDVPATEKHPMPHRA